MTQRVLVGFAESLSAIESAWSLVDAGYDVLAFTRANTKAALAHAHSDRMRLVPITSPERDAETATRDLAILIEDLIPAVVLPLDDSAVWLCDAVAAKIPLGRTAASPVFAGPLNKQAVLALDKREQFQAAEAAGFAVPPTVDCADLDHANLPGPGPWMVKPALAIQADKGRLLRPTGRVARNVAAARAVAASIGGPAVAQPLITGTGEGIFGLAARSEVFAWSAHQRIRMMNPRGSGSSACRSIPVDGELAQRVSNFVAATGWQGLFMIELLRDTSGRPWFMELNGRTWGSMALSCKRGFAYPAWAAQLALDPEYVPDVPIAAPHVTARHLGREIVHLGAVLASGQAPRLRTTKAVLTLKKDHRWYNWRRGEYRVFLADSWTTIHKQVTGKQRKLIRGIARRISPGLELDF